MTCDILLQTCLIINLIVLCTANHTVVVMGPTGAGKSSFINFLLNKGREVAIEGYTYYAETITTDAYQITNESTIIDTPGLFDNRGYTNDEITQLIKSALITQSHNSISGVMLMFNGKENKINLAAMVNAIIQMFTERILSNLIVAYNFNDKINRKKRTMFRDWSVEELAPIYDAFGINRTNLGQRIIFIDTKGDYDNYSSVLAQGLENNFDTNEINIIESDELLKEQIEEQYQKELNDLNNYKIWTEAIAHPEKKTRTVIVNVKTPYSYKCGCEKYCSWDIFGIIRGDCNTYCSTCNDVKDVPTKTIEEYIDIWYEYKERKELKYDDDYLRLRAAQNVSSHTKSKVYAALRTRNQKEL